MGKTEHKIFVLFCFSCLSLREPPDEGAGDADLLEHEGQLLDGVGAGDQAQLHHHPLPRHQAQVGAQVMLSTHLALDNIP